MPRSRDGSLALTAYIDRIIAVRDSSDTPSLLTTLTGIKNRPLSVLELGCGCGVVGIALAQTLPDCDVLLTDLAEVDELVARNIEIMTPAMSSRVKFTPLDWEVALPANVQSRTFDIIIAAECIYNTDSIPPLVNTLSTLIAQSPQAIIVVATKFRHESERMFFDLATSAGLVQSNKTSLPLPGQPGHGYGDFSTRVELYVFHGKHYRTTSTP